MHNLMSGRGDTASTDLLLDEQHTYSYWIVRPIFLRFIKITFD